jgi:gliding motility-associated-like protein
MLAVMSDMGCTDTVIDTSAVTAFATPEAGFVIQQATVPMPHPHETSILSPTVEFQNTATAGADSIMWDFGDGTVIGLGQGSTTVTGSSNTTGTYYLPSHTYADTGVYYITQWVYTPDGCMDIITDTLHIYGEYILFAPSAFTPNGDEDNDFFMPKGIGVVGEEFEMYIYDRWGDQIDKVTGVWSDDPSIGWDGHANEGKREAQTDVYVWLIKTRDFRGEEHEYIGHVTLIK